MRYIRFFDEISAGDVNLVGGKGANLGEMVRAGFPVPFGFCLTASAYRDFIGATGLDELIRGTLTNLDRPTDVDARTARIRESIRQQTLPSDMAQEIVEGYRMLGQQHNVSPTGRLPVAVRSSATAEDLPTASFAGQQDTYLNVCGDHDLVEKVKACWASLWTVRALVYRQEQGFDHNKVYLAVVVQAMIQPEVSGILFTVNPVTGDYAESVINASWGLGEAIVSGLVTPDTVTIQRSTGKIISHHIGTKERIIRRSEGGETRELETPPELQQRPALNNEQTLELAALGRQIEDHYGTPQDIEWGFENGRCYVLQARPITTLSREVYEIAEDDEYSCAMFAEIFPEPLSPIFLSVICSLFKSVLEFTFISWGFNPPSNRNAVAAFYNRPYFSRRYIETSLEPLPRGIRTKLVEQIINPFGHHDGHASSAFSLSYVRMVLSTLSFMIRFPRQLPALVARYQSSVKAVAMLCAEDASDTEIAESIRTLVSTAARQLMAHDFLMIAVIGRAYQFLGTLLYPYFGEQTTAQVAGLISGVTGNVTMDANKRIWDLAQMARRSEAVQENIRQHDAQELREKLVQTGEGRAFVAALDDFLSQYGHRESRPDILYPTWVEDFTPVLHFIRRYMDTDEAQSPHLQQARLVHERQQLTEAVMTRIRRDFRGRIVIAPLFGWLLKMTQTHTRERDTLHFELTRLFPPVRRLLLELGKRWQERQLIDQPDDVYFVTLDELVELAAAPCSIQNKIRERRTAFRANQSRPWPIVIRRSEKIYAHNEGTSESSTENTLPGIAGSPGLARGVVRIIRGPEDFGKLQPGEILVAPLTNPVWTPLFSIAGGIITEVGGILSHGAIVAREYGIPAVMSVAGATTRLPEGCVVTVDGTRGMVVLDQGSEA